MTPQTGLIISGCLLALCSLAILLSTLHRRRLVPPPRQYRQFLGTEEWHDVETDR